MDRTLFQIGNRGLKAGGPRRFGSVAAARWLLPVATVAAAVVLGRLVDDYWQSTPYTSLFICAVLISAWVGGLGPGLLAVALSVLAFDYFFLPPMVSWAVEWNVVPRLILLALSALMVAWLAASQRNRTESLRRTRDELAATVEELKTVNEALQVENAERKQAEAARRRSETHLAEAQRLSKTGSWVWNVKTKENVFWSREHYRIFGFDPDTEGGQYAVARERIHPADRRAFDENLDRAIQEQRDFEIHYRILLPGGEVKHIHNLGHPVLGGSGELVEYMGTTMDVTGQVRAGAALEEAFAKIQQSEARLQTIIDAIPTLAWSAGPDGAVDFVNLRWRNYTGLTTDQARGSGWKAAIHPEDIGRLADQRRRAITAGKPFELEARLRRFDGQYRWFITRADPLLEEHDQILKWYGTNTDIDDRKRAEEALRRAQAELTHVTRITTMGELTASIAHEVNQPLTAVVNNANACISLLPEGAPNLEEVRQALTEIIEDADRASAVIARIRQLAKNAPFERTRLDLRDVVTEVMALARQESVTRRVTLRTELPEELPPVSGDRVQLQQVLLNLVVNGMDAMNTVEEGQRVLVIGVRQEARAGMPSALVRVQDAGIGFKAEEKERLFEAFYTTKPQGMGMGLAISRSIIEAHGGRLWAEANPGPGATFLFSLPDAGHVAT